MGYLFAVIGGYLFGCSSMAFYLSKLKHVDVSKEGSGNLGASNTTILLGWKAGILVAVHDILKAVVVVLLAQMLLPELPHIGAVAGVSCVLGHIFPFYLKFRGGKGFASYFGVALAIDWKFALILAVILVLITLITDYIVCSTITAAISIPEHDGPKRNPSDDSSDSHGCDAGQAQGKLHPDLQRHRGRPSGDPPGRTPNQMTKNASTNRYSHFFTEDEIRCGS